jgi:divalent metal cation (Fe/Co/Zn/Cd) transporter
VTPTADCGGVAGSNPGPAKKAVHVESGEACREVWSATEAAMPPSPRHLAAKSEARRTRLLVIALWLTWTTVVWGLLSGSVSIVAGLLDGSLGVLGLGLNVLADVTGSAVLVWRFRAELHHDAHPDHVEERAAKVVAAALATVSLVLAISAAQALAVGSHPGHSTLGLLTASLSILILAPVAYGKRRVASELGSRALRGDGALSAVGAAVGLLALVGLWLNSAFGWWWADRIAALVIAGIAAAEAIRAMKE